MEYFIILSQDVYLKYRSFGAAAAAQLLHILVYPIIITDKPRARVRIPKGKS